MVQSVQAKTVPLACTGQQVEAKKFGQHAARVWTDQPLSSCHHEQCLGSRLSCDATQQSERAQQQGWSQTQYEFGHSRLHRVAVLVLIHQEVAGLELHALERQGMGAQQLCSLHTPLSSVEGLAMCLLS